MNVRQETTKLLKENVWVSSLDTDLGKIFFGGTQKTKETKAKIKKVGLNQTKKLCSKRKTLTKRKATYEMVELFANLVSSKSLIQKAGK